MDFVRPIADCISCLWNHGERHLNYIGRLGDSLNELRMSMDELKNHRDDVIRRVNAAEAQLLIRTNLVTGWIRSVELLEHDVDSILEEGSKQLGKSCASGCCFPKNHWTSYKLGKKAMTKLIHMKVVKSKGEFEVVAELPPPATVQLAPENSTVGLELMFANVWSLLGKEDVGIMGLYGMGGVGKTSILTKINNEFEKSKNHGFDFIIWVMITKDVNIGRVQKDIGKRLGLSWSESEPMHSRACDIFNVLRSKRFVLLLLKVIPYDIWERVDLLRIGIPRQDSESKSKVVFTTRSEAVCGWMEADSKIRVECLKWDQAWNLFKSKVGHQSLSSDPEIQKLAEKVAKKCGGLPLVLIVIGRAMASKKSAEEWKHAITTLQKHASDYDNLPNEAIRSCFLFCSLYPEGFEIHIERLIQRWIGKGYIHGFDDFEEAVNTGHDILGILKAACLLEHADDKDRNFVKMHDVIRDLAQWISLDCGREKDKRLISTGSGVTEAPKAEKWVRAETISLACTEITQLDDIPECPNLLTLFLPGNERLMKMHDAFFMFMPALRFLDLANTGVTSVPSSIGKLLFLEYLDLSSTAIKELPREMVSLVRLKYLFLRQTCNLRKIPSGLIRHLSNLQKLKVSDNNFGDSEEDMLAGIQELDMLGQLSSLDIAISNLKVLQFFSSEPRLVGCTRCLVINRNASVIINFALPASSCLNLGLFKRLRVLAILDCNEMEELKLDCWTDDMSLEVMRLQYLPKLVVSWDLKNRNASSFRNLRRVTITECDSMVDLTWLLLLSNIQYIDIQSCRRIKEIVADDSAACDGNTFSTLKTLHLEYLPSLQSICGNAVPFPSLMEMSVYNCPNLRKLPLNISNSENTVLQSIKGDVEWWNNLEWENEIIKSTFACFFSA
ncbi:mitogen-activated protein kinase kinase [Ranunculus cassubicifolius]